MQRFLYVMRHAKSDWHQPAADDFERLLNARGRRDASSMGRWMAAHGVAPEIILCSPAARAKQTAQRICGELACEAERIQWRRELYLADLGTLLKTLAELPGDTASVLLIGHNPGLEELLLHLSAEPLPYTRKGKLLTTANLARVKLPCRFDAITPRCAHDIQVTRPGDL